jgi:biopolymer transport protein ExbB
MDLFELTLIRQGGVLMYPLLVVSIIGFVLFAERTLFLHKRHIGSEVFLNGIKNLVRKRRIVEALTLCEDTPGPIANIVKAALLQWERGSEAIRGAIQSAALVEVPTLERRIGTIAAIARIAPLLGFLGTVVGAMQALYFLEQARGESALFTQYLAQALISTAAGIAIAVMATLAHHFLYGRVRALTHEFEWVGHEIHQFLLYEQTQESSLTEPEPQPQSEVDA